LVMLAQPPIAVTVNTPLNTTAVNFFMVTPLLRDGCCE
jgi:hypothetical protein